MTRRRRAASPAFSVALTSEQDGGVKKVRQEGKYVTCSVCGLAGHTLVDDGKEGYRHQNNAICTQVRKNQPK